MAERVQLRTAGATRIGDWQMVRFTGKGLAGVKIDIDKRCRKCGDAPYPGALAWLNMKQPYIYCDPCFRKVQP